MLFKFLFRNLKGYRFLIIIAISVVLLGVGADILALSKRISLFHTSKDVSIVVDFDEFLLISLTPVVSFFSSAITGHLLDKYRDLIYA